MTLAACCASPARPPSGTHYADPVSEVDGRAAVHLAQLTTPAGQ
jgi:hypothetical protein